MGRTRDFYTARFNSASVSGTFQDVGAVLTDECVEVSVINASNVSVYVSFDDGTTTAAEVPASTTWTSSAFEPAKGKFVIGKGAQTQIKQVTGTGTGFVTFNFVLEG